MTTSRLFILTASVLLGLITGAGTALTTLIGLGSVSDAVLTMIVSALLGLVSGTTTTVATASALTELASSHLHNEPVEHNPPADGDRDFLDICSRQPQHSPEVDRAPE